MSFSNTSNAGDEITLPEQETEQIPDDLGQAEHQSIAPRRRQAEQKAHTTAVDLAIFDVLSFIFEICAENDWRAPLHIGGVSRFWRDVVLHTPRAWCFLDMDASSNDCRDAYFERSGQCGLHIAMGEPDICDAIQIAPVAHRIHCMTIPVLVDSTVGPVYPCLKSLRIPSYSMNSFVDVSVLSLSRFPSLRHLEVHDAFDDNHVVSQIPPLETVVITAYDHDGWLELIDACKDSLISLRMTFKEKLAHSYAVIVDFPTLCHLEVFDGDGNQCDLAARFTTPALKTYIEATSDLWWPDDPREALKSITHLRLSRPPSLSVTRQLRVLQLTLLLGQLRRFLEDLKVHAPVFPQLELLEFLGSSMPKPEKITAKEILSKWDGNNFPRLVGPLSISECWSMEFPGENERMVRNLLHGVVPCYSNALCSAEGILRAVGGRMLRRCRQILEQQVPLASSEDRIELPH